MKKGMIIVVLSVVMATGLVGCDRRTMGAGGGAAVGATIGGLASGSAAGAAIGGVVGAVAGSEVAKHYN